MTMSKLANLLCASMALLLVGCTTTTYSEYRGENQFLGSGGTVKTVNGVEIWENGEPNRPYRIIGMIDDSRGGGMLTPSRYSAAVKLIKKHGGDAGVLLDTDSILTSVNRHGHAAYSHNSKIAVVKYLPEE